MRGSGGGRGEFQRIFNFAILYENDKSTHYNYVSHETKTSFLRGRNGTLTF